MLSMYNVLTGAEQGAADASRVISCVASTLTVTQATHSGKIINLNRVAGIAVTLPSATGTGARYIFFVGATITSNTTTLTRGTAADVMSGIAMLHKATSTYTPFLSASNSNTITLNGGTLGGTLGDWIELVDVATNQWFVNMMLVGANTLATPFSNT